jgi:hypothetical protein
MSNILNRLICYNNDYENDPAYNSPYNHHCRNSQHQRRSRSKSSLSKKYNFYKINRSLSQSPPQLPDKPSKLKKTPNNQQQQSLAPVQSNLIEQVKTNHLKSDANWSKKSAIKEPTSKTKTAIPSYLNINMNINNNRQQRLLNNDLSSCSLKSPSISTVSSSTSSYQMVQKIQNNINPIMERKIIDQLYICEKTQTKIQTNVEVVKNQVNQVLLLIIKEDICFFNFKLKLKRDVSRMNQNIEWTTRAVVSL